MAEQPKATNYQSDKCEEMLGSHKYVLNPPNIGIAKYHSGIFANVGDQISTSSVYSAASLLHK